VNIATCTNLRHSHTSTRLPDWHSIGIAPHSYFFHFNHIQCWFCNLHTQMPSIRSTPTSKIARRVFANRRLWPTINKEKPDHLEPANSLAGHDRSDLPAPSRILPISMVRSMSESTHVNPTTARLDTSPGLSDSISSSDNSGYQVHNNQK